MRIVLLLLLSLSFMKLSPQIDARCCCDGYICETDLDAKILEYCRFTPQSFIVVVFPASFNKRGDVQELLNEHVSIVYEKNIFLKNNGALNFLTIIHDIEWPNNNDTMRMQTLEKELFDGKNPIKAYVVEGSIGTAQKIESLLKASNADARMYVSFDHKKTVLLAQSILNQNSIDNLCSATYDALPHFQQCLAAYKQWIAQHHIDPEMVCINGAAVLGARGIADCSQLTFIHHGYATEVSHINSSLFVSDNASIKTQSAIDAILFNPTLHFYYKGCKFAMLK